MYKRQGHEGEVPQVRLGDDRQNEDVIGGGGSEAVCYSPDTQADTSPVGIATNNGACSIATISGASRVSIGSSLTDDYSEHDQLQADVEAKNFRSEVSKKLFPHVQYITADMKLDSLFGEYPYQMYLLEMTGGEAEHLNHYRRRWDRNVDQVGRAIKERRGGAIQAIRKGYVGEFLYKKKEPKTNMLLTEWDSLLKKEKGADAMVPDFTELYKAWDDDAALYADIVEHLVLPARGKPEKSGYASIALMSDFDSVNFTCSLVVFVLHTVKDKEAVWREQIVTGERSKNTVAKPLYTMSGRFIAKGLGFDVRKTGEESGLTIRNQMMEELEEKWENTQRYGEVLAVVKARFDTKRKRELEGRKARELEAANRKRRAPPSVRFGKVSQAQRRKLARLLGAPITDTGEV